MFTSEGPHIAMSRTDVQNGLDFHFKYCYLQFNVTRKIEKFLEIWSLQMSERVFGHVPPPPATMHLNVFYSWSIVNSDSVWKVCIVQPRY
jgi:hypothetical protein